MCDKDMCEKLCVKDGVCDKDGVSTAANGNQARHQSQPSAISATPATQSDGPCHQAPRLPRKTKVGKLCVSKWCVGKLCVWVSCVWVRCVCG